MATLKQQKVSKILTENPRLSVGQAMIQAGYSAITATRPKDVTNSQGFQELMQKYLPDKLIARKHRQLLNKKEYKRVFNDATGQYEDVKTGEIDANAVSKAIDMAYKLRGSYAPEKKLNLNASLREALEALDKPVTENPDSVSSE